MVPKRTRSPLLATAPASYRLGDLLHLGCEEPTPFYFGEDLLKYHLALFGGSGVGKSRLLELLCRRLIDSYRGFCLVDPNGDTAENLLAYVCKKADDLGNDAIAKRVLYIEPSFETVFGYDPFEYHEEPGVSEHLRANAYHAWLKTKVDTFAEIVQRKQGQTGFEGMPRLQRILTDVLTAVGTPVDDAGKHFPLSDVLVLLDRLHPRHDEVMARVLPHLPDEIRGDFDSLAAYKSERQRKDETESTINRLRSLLSPIVKAVFACTSKSIDFRKAIRERQVILVNIRKTQYFSADQRTALGGMFIHEILAATETCPREDRTQYYLLVDEAPVLAGKDLTDALDQHRKFGLSVIVAGQHPKQFELENFDMLSSILTNGGTTITFQQKHPDSLDLWKKFFGYTCLDFSELYQVTDRPDGYEEVKTVTPTFSVNAQDSVGQTRGRTTGEARTHGTGRQESRTDSTSKNRSEGTQETEQCGYQTSMAVSTVSTDGETISCDAFGLPTGSAGHASRANGRSASSGDSHAISRGRTTQVGETRGRADTSGWSEQEATQQSKQRSNQDSEQESVGVTVGYSINTSFRPKTREEWHPTGRLQRSVSDQLDVVASIIRTLPPRHAMVSLWGNNRARVIRVGDVNDPFPDAKALAEALRRMKQKIYSLHPYYVTPDLSPTASHTRLAAFLGGEGEQGVEPRSASGDREKSVFGA